MSLSPAGADQWRPPRSRGGPVGHPDRPPGRLDIDIDIDDKLARPVVTTATVVKVTHGDTIHTVVDGGPTNQVVRITGIDTPEVVDPAPSAVLRPAAQSWFTRVMITGHTQRTGRRGGLVEEFDDLLLTTDSGVEPSRPRGRTTETVEIV